MSTPITPAETDLPMAIGQPALRALLHSGYGTLATVATLTEPELRALHGVGPKAIPVLRQAFIDAGLDSPLRS